MRFDDLNAKLASKQDDTESAMGYFGYGERAREREEWAY